MASRRKITRAGGNLPLAGQFRVLYRPSLLTTQHFFLFLFLFPLFLPFLLLFSSSLSLFLYSLSLFLSTLSLFLSSSFSLLLHELKLVAPPPPPPPYKLNSDSPFIAFKVAMHVDTWHAMCHTCMPLLCIVTHGLPLVVRHLLPRNT